MAKKELEFDIDKDSQETHINHAASDRVNDWELYTDETRMINKLRKLGYGDDMIPFSGGFKVKNILISIRSKKTPKPSTPKKSRKKRVLSPEHLAKLHAGRRKAKESS